MIMFSIQIFENQLIEIVLCWIDVWNRFRKWPFWTIEQEEDVVLQEPNKNAEVQIKNVEPKNGLDKKEKSFVSLRV
jgi:hypothetical protein